MFATRCRSIVALLFVVPSPYSAACDMSQVTPSELVANKGRGLCLVGTVHCKEIKKIGGKDVIEFHLVCGDGSDPSDMIFVEAWVTMGKKLEGVENLVVLRITNPMVKPLGEKAKYQLSPNQNYVQVTQMTHVDRVKADEMPTAMPIRTIPTWPLYTMNTVKKKTHQISVIGIVKNMNICTRANGPKRTFDVIDDVKVRVSVWEHCAHILVDRNVEEDQVVLVTRLQASEGKEDTTELQTSKYTTFEIVTGDTAAQVRQRNPTPNSATSLSYDYSSRVDYATVEAQRVNMANLQSILVNGVMRDISTIFEVEHCLVRGFEALGDRETAYYLGCPECKKGMTERCPTHNIEPVPMFLGIFQIADLYSEISAKAIGDVCTQVLKIDAEGAVPDSEGHTPSLDEAVEKAMVTPLVCRFAVTKYADKQKNQIELVHAKIAIDLNTGDSFLSTEPLRLTPTTTPGIPPVLVGGLQITDGTIVYQGAAVGTVQVFVVVYDKPTDKGCLRQDGDLCRLTRSVMCCVTGTKAKIRRTGAMAEMVAYMQLKQKAHLHAVVTPLEQIDGVWHLALVACEVWEDPHVACIFNNYWQQLQSVYQATTSRDQIALDKSWTPLKRVKRIREESGSSDPTPKRQLGESPFKYPEASNTVMVC